MSPPPAAAALGMGLHLGLLLLPVLALRPASVLDPVLLVFWALVMVLHAAEAQGPSRPPAQGAVPLAAVAALAQLAVFWAGTVERALVSRAPSWPLVLGGALVFLAGIALRRASLARLRERFLDDIALLPGHRLETGGLYGIVRHPSEAGLLCLGAGAALVLQSRAAALVWLLGVVPGVMVRVRLEDRLLAGRFGPDFAAYSARVRALLPGRRS